MRNVVSRAGRALADLQAQLPWPVNVLIGLALLLLGVSLVVRPFKSLTILFLLVAAVLIADGARRIAEREASGVPLLAAAAGGALIGGGLVALLWPAAAIEALAWVVGISLLAGGAADMFAGLRARTEQRLSAVLHGLAAIIFGVLALRWPDITLLVVSIYMTARLILFGLSQILRGLRKLRARSTAGAERREARRRGGRAARWLPAAGSALLLLLASGLFVLSAVALHSPPRPDGFYDYDGQIPPEPGRLLAIEPYAENLDNARGWRILYVTTRADGEYALGSAFVMAPLASYDTPRPLVAWAHGTTGVTRRCAPTVIQPDLPALLESHASIEPALDNGWVVVGPDYPGMATRGPAPYLIGSGEARAVLDAVRATRQIDELELADGVVVWGHSQGGHAALWTGMLASAYAPEIELSGVAAAAPASDLTALLERQGHTFLGNLISAWALRAYSDWYPDVEFDSYIDARVRPVVRAMSARCVRDAGVLVSAAMSLALGDIMFSRDPSTAALGQRLIENTPVGPIPAPLQIAQGLDDPLIPPDLQDDYVRALCDAGQALEYRGYEGRGHLSLIEAGSPHVDDLIIWTQARIDGEPPVSTC